jgi:hypothetical protein
MCVTWSCRTCILAFGFGLKSGCDTLAVILPDEVKSKLSEVLSLLNQDIGQLVQDVEPISAIFKQIQG